MTSWQMVMMQMGMVMNLATDAGAATAAAGALLESGFIPLTRQVPFPYFKQPLIWQVSSLSVSIASPVATPWPRQARCSRRLRAPSCAETFILPVSAA